MITINDKNKPPPLRTTIATKKVAPNHAREDMEINKFSPTAKARAGESFGGLSLLAGQLKAAKPHRKITLKALLLEK